MLPSLVKDQVNFTMTQSKSSTPPHSGDKLLPVPDVNTSTFGIKVFLRDLIPHRLLQIVQNFLQSTFFSRPDQE